MSQMLSLFAAKRPVHAVPAHSLLRAKRGRQAVRISPKVFCDPKMPKGWEAEEEAAQEHRTTLVA